MTAFGIGSNLTFASTYTYTPYDVPDKITLTQSGQWMEFGFTGNGQRAFERDGTGTTPSRITYYAGPGFFEQDNTIAGGAASVSEVREYLATPAGTVGVVITTGNTSVTKYYLQDHLGSNIAAVDETGGGISRNSYDVWGVRTTTGAPWDNGDRGYTGHEHLNFGLIHMNGRVYDQRWGRFLQADPIIQSPYDLQNYNRYSYVMNNPLSFTDPTGFSRWTRIRDRVIKPIAIAFAAWYTGGLVSSWITSSAGESAALAAAQAGAEADTVVGAYSAGAQGVSGVASAAGGAAGGFAAGGLSGGNLQSALYGAVSGGAAGYLSGGTALRNPLDQIGAAGTAIAQGNIQDLGRMSLRYVLNAQMSRASARAAAKLGIRPDMLDVTLMMFSMAGNSVLGGGGPDGKGSRFKTTDDDFELTGGIGFRGYGNRGAAGYFFDTVDAVLAFQGKPTASFGDFAYSGLTGRPVTGHSLGTLDASYAVSTGLATRAELYSVPFGNVAPASATMRLGNFDPVNGGIMGHLLNWGARACAIGVNHGLTTYLQSGC